MRSTTLLLTTRAVARDDSSNSKSFGPPRNSSVQSAYFIWTKLVRTSNLMRVIPGRIDKANLRSQAPFLSSQTVGTEELPGSRRQNHRFWFAPGYSSARKRVQR